MLLPYTTSSPDYNLPAVQDSCSTFSPTQGADNQPAPSGGSYAKVFLLPPIRFFRPLDFAFFFVGLEVFPCCRLDHFSSFSGKTRATPPVAGAVQERTRREIQRAHQSHDPSRRRLGCRAGSL